MRGVNKVILVGHLGKDPEIRFTPEKDGKSGSICSFSLATSESWKDKNTGEPKQQTEWHRVVAFNKTGELVEQYLKKGSKVYVEGKLKTRQYEDKDKIKRFITEIVATSIQFLDVKEKNDASQLPDVKDEDVSQLNNLDDIPF